MMTIAAHVNAENPILALIVPLFLLAKKMLIAIPMILGMALVASVILPREDVYVGKGKLLDAGVRSMGIVRRIAIALERANVILPVGLVSALWVAVE